MEQLDYEIVDVFADRAFSGNPLAVVRGAGGLSTSQLQGIAREFNLSETAFPMPPTPAQAAAGAAYRLRIFTPSTELPFAGHPSVGTAWVLAQHGQLRSAVGEGEPVLQACPAGLVTVEADEKTGRISGASMPGVSTATAVPIADPLAAAAAVGLDDTDLVTLGGVASYVASAGLPFWYLLSRESAVSRAQASLARLIGLKPPPEVAHTTLNRLGGVVTVAWSGSAQVAHVRVFAADIGMVEDPATGSAALALCAVLVGSGRLPANGWSSFVVRQGAEIGRPSTLRCDVQAQDGKVAGCWVAGDVVPVATGRIRVPDPT